MEEFFLSNQAGVESRAAKSKVSGCFEPRFIGF